MNDIEKNLEDSINFLKEYYGKLEITPKIANSIKDMLSEEFSDFSFKAYRYDKRLDDILSSPKMLNFVMKRQPNISAVPNDVIDSIIECFKENALSDAGYVPIKVCRHSNHPDDNYLYSVIAKRTSDDTFACWTTYNDSTKTLNHGHYGKTTESAAQSTIAEYFYDISDDVKKYGPEVTLTDISSDKTMDLSNDKENNILAFRRRSR